MNRDYFFVIFFFISLAGFIGCATLDDYEPKTTDEEEIKTTLAEQFEAINRHEIEDILSRIHKDAKIMVGYEHTRMVLSKKQYAVQLKKAQIARYQLIPGSPTINMKGDKAFVYLPVDAEGYGFIMRYELLREHGKWYILRNQY